MPNIDYEQRLNSKPYRIFDLIYRLIVVNVLTVILSCTILLLLPSVVATISTLKQGSTNNVFKQYFKNLFHYLKKSFITGLIMILLLGISLYAIYFYATVEGIDGSLDGVLGLFVNAGFVVCFISFLVIIFLSVELPHVIVTFDSFSIGDLLKTSLYITFRYILTTLILFIISIVIIIGFICCMIRFSYLAIWLLVGVSLPLYIGVRVSLPVYKYLDKAFNRANEELNENE